MAFKPSRGNEDIAEINMIPLIDVMLVLLVIFMLAAPLLSNKIPVDLPQAKGSMEATPKKSIVLVTMDAFGKVWADGEPIGLEQLPAYLQRRQRDGANQIHLNADRNVRYDVLAQVMSMAQQAGIAKLGFVTKNSGITAQDR